MAYDNGLVETNPMRRVHKLREALARERYLTDEEDERLFEVLVGRRAHIRAIVVVALQTGMRQGDPGLEMGARGLRSKDDLCRAYQRQDDLEGFQ